MRLRAEVDKRLPIGGDEEALSADARRVVFKGVYILPSRVTGVETKPNYDEGTSGAYPYRVKVTRTHSDGTQSFSGARHDSKVYRDPLGAVAEFDNPQALNRATHVERVARRIKATTLLLAFAGGVAAIGLAKAGTFSSAEAHPIPAATSSPNPHTVEPCLDVVDGHETLVPLPEDEVNVAQKLGVTVCSLGSFDYQVAG